MEQHHGLSDRVMRGAYVPVGLADELIGLLLRLQALAAATNIEAVGPIRPPGSRGLLDAGLAVVLVLNDVDHLLDLADHCNVQVGADRWQQVTDDVRNLVLTLATRV